LEKTIKETKHALDASTDMLTSSRSELNDLIGSRTELECTIADLESASERSGDRRATLESELAQLTAQIEDRKSQIAELTPEWEEARMRESAAKRRLDEMSAQLDGLRAKQARGNRFRNRTERDNFLRPEIAALTQYRKTLDGQAEHARNELAKAHESVEEINDRIARVRGEIEEGKERGVAEAEEMRKLKEELSVLVERRKELWREDAKLDSTVSHSVEEMKTAERTLSGMMDKVCVY
jgi:structural maintenance of chromosome 3 (chondroitin sulfate proteoglycan 6)